MRRQAAVARLDGPAVGAHADLVAAEGEHRLDGQAQAGLDAAAPVARAEVGDLRLLVHLGADAVADERSARRRSRAASATSSIAAEMSAR